MAKPTYDSLVKEATSIVRLLRLKNSHRAKVADLAIKACVIKHGGRAPITRLTLKDFAEKIGIDPKTLYEWTRLRRAIFEKLTSNQQEVYNEVPYDAVRAILKEVDLKTSVRKTRSVFDKYSKILPVQTKHIRYIRNLETIIYNLGTYSRAHEIPDETIMNYLKNARIIERLAETILDSRKTKIPLKIKRPKINWDAFWTEEIKVGE